MKRLQFVFFILLLCGCATTEKYEKILNSYNGKPKATLVSNWGIPDSTYQLDKNTELLKYHSEYTYGYNLKRKCDTTFTITNGVVSNWQYKGDICEAK